MFYKVKGGVLERPGSSAFPHGQRINGTSPQEPSSLDLPTMLHAVARRAVRVAAELVAPETAKQLRAARRKLGLASLTISERKAKTDVS